MQGSGSFRCLGAPDMVRAGAKAFLSAQGAAAVVHEVAEELPAGGHLVAFDALRLRNPAQRQISSSTLHSWWTLECLSPCGVHKF